MVSACRNVSGGGDDEVEVEVVEAAAVSHSKGSSEEDKGVEEGEVVEEGPR